MKRVIITLTDCETGEIFAGTRKDVPKDGKTAQALFEKWYKCFLRGLDQKENLSCTFTYRDRLDEGELFPDFMKK